MIERAEAKGRLQPGETIVEATSGNTGNALAMMAAVKGYRMPVLLPCGTSSERIAISRAYGAEIMEIGDFHVTEPWTGPGSWARRRAISALSSSSPSLDHALNHKTKRNPL